MFPKASYFRKMFSSPTGHVELQPPVRLGDYAVDGKLELSLRSYLDLVMANNTDISIQKLSVETSRNAIMSAFGKFDPTLGISATYNHSAVPAADQLQGATVNKSTTFGPLQFDYSQLLSNGTSITSRFNGSKQSTNSAFSTYNPAFTSAFSAGFTQPLLRGRGSYITNLPITIARANLRSSELNIRNQIMSLIQQAESAYWDVVGARENLRVREEALKMRAESLKRSQRELELGAIPQLDIYQPQADYASAEIQVSQARFRLAQLEDALRRQIGADLDPKFRTMPITLTETVMPPTEATPLDREALVDKAISMRPDLQSSRVSLEVDDMNIRSASDQLRPNLSLTGNYASNGRGGDQYLRTGLGSTAVTTVYPGGLYDALAEVFGFNNTTYRLGLTLTLPLRDRAGAARLADSLVRKKQDTLSLRSREQSIRLEVLNAVSQVESSRESVKLAIVARDLAQKQLDAEKQKYDLGTSQMYYVLDAQTRLTNAESSVVTESINYRRNQLQLLRVVGTLLDERGITIQ
ncbi:MAG: TolC family protein [Bryobacteraceae bacterium]